MLAALMLSLVCADSLASTAELESLMSRQPNMDAASALNRAYCLAGDFETAARMLSSYERSAPEDEKAIINFMIADGHLYAGRIIDARERYLQTVSRFARHPIANDALERLFLIETARQDTALLTRLARAICYYSNARPVLAAESLKVLIPTGLGDQALYFTALAFEAQDRLELALGALVELSIKFPHHAIHAADLCAARLNIRLKDFKTARAVLESLIVREPGTVYAVQAREILKEIK